MQDVPRPEVADDQPLGVPGLAAFWVTETKQSSRLPAVRLAPAPQAGVTAAPTALTLAVPAAPTKAKATT
jgi:hypothetical protein